MYELDGIKYEIVIQRKLNKNTYIKVKDDLKIYVTTNLFMSNAKILELIKKNNQAINRMINKRVKAKSTNEKFSYLGIKYDIIIVPTLKDIEFENNKILVKSDTYFDKWLKEQTKKIFKEHLDKMYQLFDENLPYPLLKIRTMKTRWGVCNRKNTSITLNSNLIKYDANYLDYVIIHELSHFKHFNHSPNFWNLVSKYCPDYKRMRHYLREQ